MTEYIQVHAPGLVLLLTRQEFFRALDRSDTLAGCRPGDRILQSEEASRRPGE